MIQTGRDCQRLKVEEGVQLGAFQDGNCYAGHDEGHGHKSENRRRKKPPKKMFKQLFFLNFNFTSNEKKLT